jgi:hypothetical protein
MAEDEINEQPPAGLAIRRGGDRRCRDRRSVDRGGPNRRKRDRRITAARGILFSAFTLVTPFHVRLHMLTEKLPRIIIPSPSAEQPKVEVSIDTVDAIEPSRAYDHLIKEAAKAYKLEPALIRSVIRMESAFDPFAVSRVGAMGLMQLMPDVAKELGVTDPFDPRQNIMGGSRLLRDLLDRHKGNLKLTLASYNAGPGTVAKYRNRIPPFKETRNYVKRITEWIEDERAGS